MEYTIKQVEITAENIKSIEHINKICFHDMESITFLFSGILFDAENKGTEEIISNVLKGMYPNPVLFIAYIGDEPVGFHTGYQKEKDNPDEGYYGAKKGVLPDHRGKGIGKALLKNITDFASTNGYDKYSYHTFPINDPANLLIGLKAGFVIKDQQIATYPWNKAEESTALLLTKELDAIF